ncbi:hypothetical protein WDU94_012439 [Cyamophila willieti]
MYECAGGFVAYRGIYSTAIINVTITMSADEFRQFYNLQMSRPIHYIVFAHPNDSLLTKPVVNYLFETAKALVVVLPAPVAAINDQHSGAGGVVDKTQLLGLATYHKYQVLFNYLYWMTQIQAAARFSNGNSFVSGRKRTHKNKLHNGPSTIQVRVLSQFATNNNDDSSNKHQSIVLDHLPIQLFVRRSSTMDITALSSGQPPPTPPSQSTINNNNNNNNNIDDVSAQFVRRFDVDNLIGYRVSRIGARNEPQLDIDQFLELVTRCDSMRNKIELQVKKCTATGVPLSSELKQMQSIYAEAFAIFKSYDNANLRTLLNFGPNNFITTPPLDELNHPYVTVVRNIFHTDQIEKLHRAEVEQEPLNISKEKEEENSTHLIKQPPPPPHTIGGFKPRTASKRTINPISTAIVVKKLKEAELMNGSLKKQTQGSESVMRQKILPQLCLNVIRAPVLSDETLPLNVLSIPTKYKAFVESAPCTAIVKRDPVLRAILTFDSFYFHDEDCFKLSSALFKPINLDLDGDTITAFFIFSMAALIEQAVQTHIEYNMYRHFRHTIAVFNQPHVMLAHRYKHDLVSKLPLWMADIFTLASSVCDNVQTALQESLTVIAETAAPYGNHDRAPYEFVSTVVRLLYEIGSNDIMPMASFDPIDTDDAFNVIFESGAKGDALLANRLRTNVPISNQQMAHDSWLQHNSLIDANTTVWTEYYNFFRLIQPLQNVKIDSSGMIVYTIEDKVYTFGHATTKKMKERAQEALTTFNIKSNLGYIPNQLQQSRTLYESQIQDILATFVAKTNVTGDMGFVLGCTRGDMVFTRRVLGFATGNMEFVLGFELGFATGDMGFELGFATGDMGFELGFATRDMGFVLGFTTGDMGIELGFTASDMEHRYVTPQVTCCDTTSELSPQWI